MALILDPRVACDMHLMVLVLVSGDVVYNDVVSFSVLPGDLIKRWQAFVSTSRVWLPESESHSGSPLSVLAGDLPTAPASSPTAAP